ncbi:rhomboid family intramembrane serine protease [Jatrophihabitans sp. YIM 134969]
MSDTQTGLARCYRHPMRETGVRCVRCDRPICPDCMRPASVGFMCPDDVKLGNATIRQPRTSVGASVARSATPWVSYTLIGLNVALFLITFGTTNVGVLHNQGGGLYRSWILVPSLVLQSHEYLRLFTSAFLHLSLLHLAFNMLALYVLGPPLETLLGRWRFVAVYLLSALGGSVAVLWLSPFNTATVGASGAIFGLFGAALLLYRQLRIDPRSLVMTLVLNLVITFTLPFISWQGHVGGLLVGALAGAAIGGLPTRTPRRLDTRWQGVGLGVLLLALVLLTVAAQAVRG